MMYLDQQTFLYYLWELDNFKDDVTKTSYQNDQRRIGIRQQLYNVNINLEVEIVDVLYDKRLSLRISGEKRIIECSIAWELNSTINLNNFQKGDKMNVIIKSSNDDSGHYFSYELQNWQYLNR